VSKKLTYTETTLHGPEVDFGVGWTLDGEGYLRVTWVEYLDSTGFTGRGDVKAFKGNEEVALLGRDIPLFVVEHILSLPALDTPDQAGWATACLAKKDVSWVEKRLAKWNGCLVVTYAGKEHRKGEEKAARAYAESRGYYAREGGWIYDSRGRTITQGWASFAANLKSSRVVLPIRQENNGEGYPNRRYSETWIVSVNRSAFGMT